MKTKRQEYVAALTKLLQDRKKYNDALAVSVEQVADALIVRDLCRKDLDGLDSTTVTETTRYGGKLIPHPVFKIMHDAQATLVKVCKSLGITYDEMSEELEPDPFAEIMQRLNEE